MTLSLCTFYWRWIFFVLLRKDFKIKGINIFEHCFLYITYVYDTTPFLENSQSTGHLVEIDKTFTVFSELKPNLTKEEIERTETMKGVQLAVCGMKSIHLRNEAFKILDTQFSYNNRI